jgi:lipooligosaccharide transport system permease protein
MLIGPITTSTGQSVPYAAFVAPALLATSAMNTSMEETTVAVWVRLRFEKFYEAIVTTPLGPGDIACGEVAAAMLRGALATTSFLIIVTAFGLITSWWGLLVLPGAFLVAFAFAGMGIAVATFLRKWHHQQYVQLVMLPMFLFATTFYPLSTYPHSLQWIVAVFPLTQATALLRALTLGEIDLNTLIAAGYLTLLGLGGLWLGHRRLGRLLLK